MKYIRTKDSIYELEKLFGTEYIETDGGGTKATYKKLKDISIDYDMYFGCKTKQADTIEKLCDEFVAVVNNSPQQHQFMKPFDYYMRSLNPKDVSLFGAIWTDKGLIYVAKMNDKGELELL